MFKDEYDKSDLVVSLAPQPPSIPLQTPLPQKTKEYLFISP